MVCWGALMSNCHCTEWKWGLLGLPFSDYPTNSYSNQVLAFYTLPSHPLYNIAQQDSSTLKTALSLVQVQKAGISQVMSDNRPEGDREVFLILLKWFSTLTEQSPCGL